MKKQQEKKQQPGEAIGLDLSDRTGQYCDLDADGEVLTEGKVTLTAAGLKRGFGHLARTRIAIRDRRALRVGEALPGETWPRSDRRERAKPGIDHR